MLRAAEASETKGDYETAALQYDALAQQASGPERDRFDAAAHEAQRRVMVEKGRSAADHGDLKTAEDFYSRAQEIKSDPLVAQRLQQVRDTLHERDVRAQYDAAMKAGLELMKTDLPQAREQFLAAKQLRPTNEAELKIKEVDGRDLLAQGDAARAKNDFKTAEALYHQAADKCYLLVPDVRDRIDNLRVLSQQAQGVQK